jgi:hypothetical protein
MRPCANSRARGLVESSRSANAGSGREDVPAGQRPGAGPRRTVVREDAQRLPWLSSSLYRALRVFGSEPCWFLGTTWPAGGRG